MAGQLNQQDVQRLLADPSVDSRAGLAGKLGSHLDGEGLSTTERGIAESIVRLLARDAAVRVRQALADSLKHSAGLPRDIALALARDVEAVALPILSASAVLTDQDLIDLVQTGTPTRQTAIARRPTVPAGVADALIDAGTESVVAALVANEGADLREASLGRLLDRFGDNEAVQGPLVRRSRLPVTISERLVALVSDRLRDYLVTHHELPAELVGDLVLQSRERATMTLISGDGGEAIDLDALVAQLQQNGRLTPSLLLRALCMGDIPFFEAALSLLAKVPVTNARLLIHDAGRLGLKSIYERAGLPPALLPAVRVALTVAQETPFDGEPGDRERHQRKMIERILTQFEDLGRDDLDYLLTKLGDLVRDPS